jgi:hypothetical protein
MLTAIADERARVPAPEYSYGTDMDEFNKARVAYEDDLNQRVGAQARSILNSDQLSAYNEYQQAQKDIRGQFATMMPHGPRTMIRGGVAGGNVVSGAASVGAYMQADAVSVAVPSESDKK